MIDLFFVFYSMNHKKALVTLVVGEKYQQFWKKYCQKNWQKYAEKHGYDLVCISELLDNSERGKKRPPHWQKCLILSQEFSKKYERIVWLDSDVVINWQDAPCICENLPKEKVGAVKSWAVPTTKLQ